jgi:hypothetical protein
MLEYGEDDAGEDADLSEPELPALFHPCFFPRNLLGSCGLTFPVWLLARYYGLKSIEKAPGKR